MDKLEKVIRALENCTDTPKCKDCPWETCEAFDGVDIEIPRDLAIAALELLKAQEPMKPIMIHGEYECGFCRNEVSPDSNTFCACCGRKVKWE